MTSENGILNGLSTFARATLEDARRVSFLNRYDTKFVLRSDNVPDFLDNIRNDYSVLEIGTQLGAQIVQSYSTVYFDTPELLCFNLHHNKRARRFKFRTRKYLSNGKIFNEIKQKQNTGKTIKFRQRRDGQPDIAEAGFPVLPVLSDLSNFDEHFAALVRENGYMIETLLPSLYVYFSRVTFLNNNFAERMTLDVGLKYGYDGYELSLYDTAIVELKRERSPERTVSQDYFRKIHKCPSGFSKYIIGISLTHAEAKKNRFLPKLRYLNYERSAA